MALTKVSYGLITADASSADLNIDANTMFVDASTNKVGIGTTSPNGLLHVGSSNATGDSANPAIQIGGANTYRLGFYTDSEGGIIQNLNGDNGLQFRVKTAGEVMRIMPSGNVGIGITNPSQLLTLKANTPFIQFAQDGSDSYAGINFGDDDDANDGQILYDHDSRYMRFQVANAERLRINASGNVGIGETNPDAPLHITSNTPIIAYDESDTSQEFRLGSFGGAFALYDSNDSAFRILVDGDGKVGIGNTTPGNSHANANMLVVGSGSAGGMALYNGANAGGYYFARDNANNTDAYDGGMAYDGSRNLTFHTNAGSERLRIDGSGNVGIGSTTINAKLNVHGIIRAENSPFYAGREDAAAPAYAFHDDADTGMFNVASNILGFSTSGTERMRINSSGHLLVGTTSDAALDGVSPGICVGSTSSTTSGITFSNANHEWLIYNASDGKLRFYDSTDNTEFAYVDTARRFTFGGNFAHSTYGHVAVFGENSVPNGVVVMEDFDVSSGIGNTILNLYFRDQDPATHAVYIDFRDGGGRVGSVTHNDDGGGVTYNTTSDYRLKENVNYDWDATTLLKQLKPAKFNFIGKTDKTRQGFLAHEVMDIVPGSVRGTKDQMEPVGTITDNDGNVVDEGVYEHFCKTDEGQKWTQTGTEPYYQELDYSRLVPLLVKTVQEQQTIIEDLQSRVTTLEG